MSIAGSLNQQEYADPHISSSVGWLDEGTLMDIGLSEQNMTVALSGGVIYHSVPR